jgi:hypothetical protein
MIAIAMGQNRREREIVYEPETYDEQFSPNFPPNLFSHGTPWVYSVADTGIHKDVVENNFLDA